MKYLIIIGIWFVVFIADGIVIPALTGLPAGLGTMIFLSALAITFGIHRWVIGWGIVLAGLTEFYLGIYFGTIIGAWLVMAWVWYLLNKFLNMKSINENSSLVALVPYTFLGLGLFGLGEVVMWAISRFGYESGLTSSALFQIISSPVIAGVVAVELVVTLFMLHLINFPQNAQ